MFYASSAAKKQALAKLRTCDILLTTPHMIGVSTGLTSTLISKMRVHRLVVDEAHLLDKSSMGSKLGSLRAIQTRRSWCVTGTPFSTQLEQLRPQARLLGIEADLNETIRCADNDALVDWLKARMIRHTKSMRIGGEVALALPDSDCQTTWVEMTEDERLLYGVSECDGGHALSLTGPAATTRFRAASHLYAPHVICGQEHALNSFFKASYGDPLKVYPSHTLTSPSSEGSFKEASAAYLRVHHAVQVENKKSKHEKLANPNAPVTYRTEYRPLRECTKFAKLLADLKELRGTEPDFHAVIFTQFDEVHARLVQLIGEESSKPDGMLYQGKAAKLKIFEFSKSTAPTSRHKRIQEFQQGGGTRWASHTHATTSQLACLPCYTADVTRLTPALPLRLMPRV